MQMNDTQEIQESGCTGRGGRRIEGEEAGPETSDREGGTERWSKKVGQKQGTERQRCREMEREKVRKTEVPRHIGRN